MRPSGKVNLIAVLLIGAAAYGVWWAFTFGQIYLDNIDVTDAVTSGFNDSARQTDEYVKTIIAGKLGARTLGWHEEDDGYGTIKQMPGLGIKPEDVIIERDTVRNTVRVEVDYTRKVYLKPSDKVKFVKFRVKHEGPAPHD